MCDFFSFVEDGMGKRYFFDWEQRKNRELKNPQGQTVDSFDSHSEICSYYDLNVDNVNKYEYNPLTKRFTVDQINIKDRSVHSEKWVRNLDFSKIVNPLVLKPINNPFELETDPNLEYAIELVKEWASVWDSVWDSVRDSVRASVWDSVGVSVRSSVWASVGAYMSSFFELEEWKYVDHEKGKNPFQTCIDLWEMGYVASYDGTTWRLHAGKDAKIVYGWEGGEG